MLLLTVLCLYLVAASATILPPYSRGDGRIVGGVETTIEDRPFSASLQTTVAGIIYSHSCGASILNTRYLLSAAHCRPLISTLYARVGSTRFASGGDVYEVQTFTQHPLYNRNILDYDIAVLRLTTEIVLGPNVVPVTLATSPDPGTDEITTVSGWGVTSESSSSASPVLRKVDLPVFDEAGCRGVYAFLTPRHICLGGTPQGGTSACFGDSGGPVTFNGNQIATVSGGSSCSAPNIPGLYTRVSVVLDWIRENAEMN